MRDAIGQASTIAGTGAPGVDDGPRWSASFDDPFGIAIDRRGNIIVSEGGASNRIRRITQAGNVETLAGSDEGFADGPAVEALFNTPSAVAVDPGGGIIVADTSNNRIRRVAPNGSVTTIAGNGSAGFRDGPAGEAQFDGPVGVAIDHQGNIFVADTYNDRIRRISIAGDVITTAGSGLPGFVDGEAEAARFDTPSGVAVDQEGNLFVADTGNNAVRKVSSSGQVTTLAGRSEEFESLTTDDRLERPVGIAVTHDGFIFVACQDQGRVFRVTPEGVIDLFVGSRSGFQDGIGSVARFSRPSAVAVDREGSLYIADAANYLIRKVSPVRPPPERPGNNRQHELVIQPGQRGGGKPDLVIPRLDGFFAGLPRPFPWPLSPQDQWHEVTGVAGEARGAPGGVALDHLHSGLDVRGRMGDPVLAVIDQKVSSPIPNWDFGGASEGIQVGLISYVHVRVGRDVNDRIQPGSGFKPKLDEAGTAAGVRVRRGVRFRAGELIGTVNELYHVHLNIGPWNAEANPIQLSFASFKDTSPPVVERGGIEVIATSGEQFREQVEGRLMIEGDVDIVVTAYDVVDGNSKRRKLGLYKVGYQLLNEDGTPAPGFREPLINIEFNRLPPDERSVFLVYAPGSGVSAYGGSTRFRYVVTNWVRDGRAADGLLRTAHLPSGDYILNVMAEDFAGNRASGPSTQLRVRIAN
jgi:sugar lactone lactonase YvrE